MLQQYKTILSSKTQLTENVFLFRFSLSVGQHLDFQAGQYMILMLPDGKQRLYSICSPEQEKQYFELVVEVVEGGAGSTYLRNINIGDEVNFKGPAGLFVLRQQSPRDIVFLVTGTGIAPARSIILSYLYSKFEIPNSKFLYLFWGLKKHEDVYFKEEFGKLSAEQENFNFHICLSREEAADQLSKCFFKGHIDDGLMEMLNMNGSLHLSHDTLHESLKNFDYYLCGSKQVVESLLKFLQEKGVPQEQIIVERFG